MSYLDHVSPRLSEVLAVLDDAVVVPLLLGAAYHSRIDVPAAIADAGAVAVQADVLGPDPLLLDALERRLARGRRDRSATGTRLWSWRPPVPPTTAAVADVRSLAASLGRSRLVGGRAGLRLRGRDPRSRRRSRRSAPGGAPGIAVASYLLFPGLFADRLNEAGADVTSGVLGDAPEVAELVLARYDAAVTRPEA